MKACSFARASTTVIHLSLSLQESYGCESVGSITITRRRREQLNGCICTTTRPEMSTALIQRSMCQIIPYPLSCGLKQQPGGAAYDETVSESELCSSLYVESHPKPNLRKRDDGPLRPMQRQRSRAMEINMVIIHAQHTREHTHTHTHTLHVFFCCRRKAQSQLELEPKWLEPKWLRTARLRTSHDGSVVSTASLRIAHSFRDGRPFLHIARRFRDEHPVPAHRTQLP